MTSTPWLSRRALLGGAAAIGSASPAGRLHRLRPRHVRAAPTTAAPPVRPGHPADRVPGPEDEGRAGDARQGLRRAGATVNAVATEQFRAQLSTYLTSGTAPEVIGWFAGSVARSYASKGLLLDVVLSGPATARARSTRTRCAPSAATRAASRSSCRPATTGGASSTRSRRSRSGASSRRRLGRLHRPLREPQGPGHAPADQRHGIHAVDGLGLVRLPQPAGQRRAVPPGPAGREVRVQRRAGRRRLEKYKQLIPYFDTNCAPTPRRRPPRRWRRTSRRCISSARSSASRSRRPWRRP